MVGGDCTSCGFDALEDVGAGLEDEAQPLRVQSAGHGRVWRAEGNGDARLGVRSVGSFRGSVPFVCTRGDAILLVCISTSARARCWCYRQSLLTHLGMALQYDAGILLVQRMAAMSLCGWLGRDCGGMLLWTGSILNAHPAIRPRVPPRLR